MLVGAAWALANGATVAKAAAKAIAPSDFMLFPSLSD
jgi:hypothetical protein